MIFLFWHPAGALGQRQLVVYSIHLSQSLLALKECAIHLIDQHAPATEYGLGFVSRTWSYQMVSHPSTLQAQGGLASVFKWELVFPTWRGPLA